MGTPKRTDFLIKGDNIHLENLYPNREGAGSRFFIFENPICCKKRPPKSNYKNYQMKYPLL